MLAAATSALGCMQGKSIHLHRSVVFAMKCRRKKPKSSNRENVSYDTEVSCLCMEHLLKMLLQGKSRL